MKNKILMIITVLICSTPPAAIGLPSVSFLKRGGAHCTGYCESNKINCARERNIQGYYDWCKKNCTHEDKNNRDAFTEAIQICDKYKYQGRISALNIKGKDIRGENEIYHQVEVIWPAPSNNTKFLRLRAVNTQGLKIGDNIFFQNYIIEEQKLSQKDEAERQAQIRQGHRPDISPVSYYYVKSGWQKG